MKLLTSIDDVVQKIPQEATGPLQKKLTDILLKSKKGQMLDPNLAKSILNNYHDNDLKSPEGFKTLLEAAVSLEKEKVAEKMQELNLNEAAAQLGGN